MIANEASRSFSFEAVACDKKAAKKAAFDAATAWAAATRAHVNADLQRRTQAYENDTVMVGGGINAAGQAAWNALFAGI